MERYFLIEKALCKGISLLKRLFVKGFPYEALCKGLSLFVPSLLKRLFVKRISLLKKSLCKEISFLKRLFVKGFPFEALCPFLIEKALCKKEIPY